MNFIEWFLENHIGECSYYQQVVHEDVSGSHQ